MSSETLRLNPLEGHPRYEKVADLSSGSFGFVLKARKKGENQVYAVKFLPRGRNIQRYVLREILNHRSLRHPHVVQFHEVFLTHDYLAIVMEYADQGDLFSFVQARNKLSEEVARWIFQQLIFGLDYCHRKGVANRDIKLENVLLQTGNRLPLVKLCDFGYSKHEDWDSAPRSRVGTPDYMAPEVITTSGNSYDAKMSDLWSCGVVLYVMLVGQYPFSRTSDNSLREDQRVNEVLGRVMQLDFNVPSHLSANGRDLLTRLLTNSPDRRATIQEVMHHPWYMEGLPLSALKMNDVYLKNTSDANSQSLEECGRIVEKAMKHPDDLTTTTTPEDPTEELIAAALEEEEEGAE